MLQQLIAEAENKAVVFSDDLSVQMREEHLQGLVACQEDDVVHKNWLSTFVLGQIKLRIFLYLFHEDKITILLPQLLLSIARCCSRVVKLKVTLS